MSDKYIKLSQALEVLDACSCWWAHERMECIPAADVVEVVRCKDCVYLTGKDTPGGKIWNPNVICHQMKENGFCSYGERRSE